ncbi:MAG: GGDEF domain-containing protein [Oleispira sp.]|nr:GGDEF domain-containing protein [Oleispira sp.]MBL4882334.1 GGDEF domain-containing protein [Oleispira sp.]
MKNKHLNMSSFDDLSETQKHHCEMQISEDLIARSIPGSIMVLLLWVCVAWLIDSRNGDTATTQWLLNLSMIFIVAIGLRSYFFYIGSKHVANTVICRFYITLGLSIGCLSWGIMAACSYLETPLFTHQNLILITTVGLSAGGAVSFSASRFYTYLYVLCMLVPILLVEFFIAEQIIVERVTIVIMYIIGLLWVTVNSSKEYMSARVSNIRLLEMSNTDGLTEVKNRRYFDLQLEEEIQRARRTKGSIALLILDIDNFKKVNDEYGHITGDKCLIAVANCLKISVQRISDTVARYGGEEFAIIIANTDEANCLKIAEHIRTAVEDIQVIENNMAVSLTISIGVSQCKSADVQCDAVSLLAAADKALYQAKKQGRNQVCSNILIPATS